MVTMDLISSSKCYLPTTFFINRIFNPFIKSLFDHHHCCCCCTMNWAVYINCKSFAAADPSQASWQSGVLDFYYLPSLTFVSVSTSIMCRRSDSQNGGGKKKHVDSTVSLLWLGKVWLICYIQTHVWRWWTWCLEYFYLMGLCSH